MCIRQCTTTTTKRKSLPISRCGQLSPSAPLRVLTWHSQGHHRHLPLEAGIKVDGGGVDDGGWQGRHVPRARTRARGRTRWATSRWGKGRHRARLACHMPPRVPRCKARGPDGIMAYAGTESSSVPGVADAAAQGVGNERGGTARRLLSCRFLGGSGPVWSVPVR
jgi:hypothetical protein